MMNGDRKNEMINKIPKSNWEWNISLGFQGNKSVLIKIKI